MNLKMLCVHILLTVLVASGASAEKIRFAVVSDTQGDQINEAINVRVFPAIVDNVLATDPPVQFVIVTGDLVNGSRDEAIASEQYAQWRQLASPWYQSNMTGLKVYALPGNHDLWNDANDGEFWRQAFPELPDNGPDTEKKMTYSFDVGPCHIAAVKTFSPIAGYRVDTDWLAQDLSASSAPVKLVFGPAPAYPALLHVGSSLDESPDQRNQFWDLLASQNVKAYFCGHEHLLDHWMYNGVHQIIAGGGGGFSTFHHYLIVDADEEELTINVHRYTGELYRQFTLSPQNPVAMDDRANPNRTIASVLLTDPVGLLDIVLPCFPSLLVLTPLIFLGFAGLGRDGC